MGGAMVTRVRRSVDHESRSPCLRGPMLVIDDVRLASSKLRSLHEEHRSEALLIGTLECGPYGLPQHGCNVKLLDKDQIDP